MDKKINNAFIIFQSSELGSQRERGRRELGVEHAVVPCAVALVVSGLALQRTYLVGMGISIRRFRIGKVYL